MDINQTEKGGVIILELKGDVDSLSSFDLSRIVREALARDKVRFVFNLEGVEYINSSGLGSMISLLKKSREKDGDVKLASVRSEVFELLQQTHMDKLFEIFNSTDEALEKFASG